MKNIEYSSRFENIVGKILETARFNIKPLKNTELYDLCASKDDIEYVIEVKAPRVKRMSGQFLVKIATRLVNIAKEKNDNRGIILVICAVIDDDVRDELKQRKINIIIIDIKNLLFQVRENYDLKNDLLSFLNFSVDDILPKSHYILSDYSNYNDRQQTKCKSLIEKIRGWDSKNDNNSKSVEYEKMCYDVLRELFENNLAMWNEQETSNDDLYRFDLICKIKDEQSSGFWLAMLKYFNSRYIIFEFKNYSDKLKQNVIYTTEKYLYLKALRSVAIIISCHGTTPSAEKAIRGVLRENGKLIISLKNDDLVKMLELKNRDSDPADYLDEKLDSLLVDLEK